MTPIFKPLFCILLVSHTMSAHSAEPKPIIFDTDMESDCDDVGALAIVHALADRGEVKILATTVSARFPASPACVDAINTFYGRPQIPIGVALDGHQRQGSSFAKQLSQEFPHDFPTDSPPDAVKVYRQALTSQPDGSVIIITVGDLTNIKNLLQSKGDALSPLNGIELAKAKVKVWVCMGSRYPADKDPKPWGNFKMDPQATNEAIQLWPGQIIFTGGGAFANQLATGAGLDELPKKNPIRRAYELYFGGKVKNRHSADQIAVMVAARGPGSPWHQVQRGHNHIFENGTHEWREIPDNPRHSYVSSLAEGVDQRTVAKKIEELMMHKPTESDR